MQTTRKFTANARRGAFAGALFVAAGGFWGWQYLRNEPVRYRIAVGRQFLAQGLYPAAEAAWREAVRLQPNNAEAWSLLADLHIKNGEWPMAQASLERLRAVQPAAPELFSRLAMCALRQNDAVTARNFCEEALKHNPNDISALKMLADLAKNDQRHDDQLRYLQRAVELQPDDADAVVSLADEWTRRGEYEKARPLVERVLQARPDYISAYFLRGVIARGEGTSAEKLKQAEGDFKKVLAAEPQNIEAHRQLARVFVLQKRADEAIPHFEAIGRGRPYASAHWLELATVYRKVGKVRQADALLKCFTAIKQENRQIMDVRDRLAQNPASFEDNLQLARLLFNSVNASEASYHLYAFRHGKGQLRSIEFHARKALEAQPNDPRALTLRRQIEQKFQQHLKAGEEALTRKDYRQAEWHLGHAKLLRPDQMRLQSALQRLAVNNGAAPIATP